MKISIHPLTYILLLSILLCGYFNYFLIISTILLIHDIGHLLVMYLFNISVYKIVVLPFGSIINTSISYNLDSNKLLLVSLSGIIMQLILYIVFYYLHKYLLINDLSYHIFLTYNKYIIIFNILPIIPLDGSKALISLLERFIPYRLSIIICNLISIILISIFILFNDLSLNLILISIFLYYKTYTEILNINFIFNKFLLERYLSKITHKKVKYISNIKSIYKNRLNIINSKKEDKILAKIFDIKTYF